MNIKQDTYRVTWSPEDNEHLGLCAEFPSLSWLAKTPEAALKGISKASNPCCVYQAGAKGWAVAWDLSHRRSGVAAVA